MPSCPGPAAPPQLSLALEEEDTDLAEADLVSIGRTIR